MGKMQVDTIIRPYNKSWTLTTEELKADLENIHETQESLQTMMDDMAKGMSFIPKKTKTRKTQVLEYDSEAFESEDSFVEDGDGEDSEYEPTPNKSKRKRRSPRPAKKETTKKEVVPDSPPSAIGENYIDEIDSKKLGSLKKACKKLGVRVTGKKADLKERVRETILNSSMALNSSIAMPNPSEGNDESFIIDSSAVKRVNFEIHVSADPEFQPIIGECSPINENPPADSVKKQLWHKTGNISFDIKPKHSPRKPVPKTPLRMTPNKRKRSPCSDKENTSCTPKRHRLGFLSSSPRPMALQSAQEILPNHGKLTIASSKKATQPVTAKTKKLTMSTKKRNRNGMNTAVSLALAQGKHLL